MIAIKGIRLNSLSLERDDDGKEKVTGSYSLMSMEDKVLAKQSFNGYNDIEVAWSAETQKLLSELNKNIKVDIQSVLGIEEEK